MPSGVVWVRTITPDLQPPVQRNVDANCTSCKGLSRISQPPAGVRGVPTISPFCARQSASPSVRNPVSEDPLKVQSGAKFLFAAAGRISRPKPATTTIKQPICFHIGPPDDCGRIQDMFKFVPLEYYTQF